MSSRIKCKLHRDGSSHQYLIHTCGILIYRLFQYNNLASISKNSWAMQLRLASVLTGVLYPHVKYWHRAPFFWPYLRQKSDVERHSTVRSKPTCWFQCTEFLQTVSCAWEIDGYIYNPFWELKILASFMHVCPTQISEISEKNVLFFLFFFHFFVDISASSAQQKSIGMCRNCGETLPWAMPWPTLSSCYREESFALFIPKDFTGCWQLSVPFSTYPWGHISL